MVTAKYQNTKQSADNDRLKNTQQTKNRFKHFWFQLQFQGHSQKVNVNKGQGTKYGVKQEKKALLQIVLTI